MSTITIPHTGIPTFAENYAGPVFTPSVDGASYYPGSCHGVCPGYHWAKLEVLGGSPFDMSWNLESSGPVSWEWDPYDSEIVFEVVPYYTSFPFSFVGTVSNLCGPSQFTFCFMSGPNCEQGYGYSFSPNPSSDELVISKDDSNGTTGSSGETEVVLYNSAMEKVYSVVSTSAIIKVPVKEMREGNYFLHIISKDGIVQRQVVVKHWQRSPNHDIEPWKLSIGRWLFNTQFSILIPMTMGTNIQRWKIQFRFFNLSAQLPIPAYPNKTSPLLSE